MRNFINLALVEERNISGESVDRLNHLHFIMNCVIRTAHAPSMPISAAPEFRDAVEWLEFEMQKEWRFDQDEGWHTHCLRLPHTFLDPEEEVDLCE